jgi:hypothetical protein
VKPREAQEKATAFVDSALVEAELAETLYEKGREQESRRQEIRSQLHAGLATALMLTHGIMFTSDVSE